MSAWGKASGSRNSRSAMYWAVHSPTPGRAFSAVMALSRSARGVKIVGSAATVRASASSAAPRDLGMPRAAMSCPTNSPGVGKARVRPSEAAKGSSICAP